MIKKAKHASNHHRSIVEVKSLWLHFYHRWLLDPESPRPTKRQRRIGGEYLPFTPDGTIHPIARTATGAGPLK